jgi:diaminopimelate epimerase
VSFPFVKGHGTHNDFVLLPDFDGSVHGDLSPQLVAELCDRHGGIGADGVLRVIRTSPEAPWFMDYRNADGSTSEMCGNGIRVLARYLAEQGLIDPSRPVSIDSRDGIKLVRFCDDGEISVDLGVVTVGGDVKIAVEGREYVAHSADVGNPHAVALVEDLAEAGRLYERPDYAADDFPNGVNVEFVVVRGDRDVAMRVYERGVGETQSCGTGACAGAAVVASRQDAQLPASYRVQVPGGIVTVTLDHKHHAHLKGPAVLVAEGTWRA